MNTFREKLSPRDAIVERLANLRISSKRIGYTSGVFDLLHLGHASYLEKAKALVDVLVVGVNSDASVRQNKGPSRPINTEQQRALIVAALASVDLVFIFDELNNNLNVELIKPDVYIKAGDYSAKTLSSAPTVEKYGGKVELISLEEGLSTTNMIAKIESEARSFGGEIVTYEKRPAVFVDRDGTINELVEYLSQPEKFQEIPGSFGALKKLQDTGYRVVVVTNQPGIGLGYYTREDLFLVNREMMRQASKLGLSIDRIHFCPHSKADKCRCRKPDTLLVEQAAKDLNIDLEKSFVIGDMTSDIKLAENAGCRAILVQTGRGGDDGMYSISAAATVKNLAAASDFILNNG